MTKQTILGMSLVCFLDVEDFRTANIEEKKRGYSNSLCMIANIVNHPAPSKDPIIWPKKEEFPELIKRLRSHFKNAPKVVRTTTVEMVLKAWSEKHQAYDEMHERCQRNTILSLMASLFKHLISLGFPEEDLRNMPGGKSVFESPTVQDRVDRMSAQLVRLT